MEAKKHGMTLSMGFRKKILISFCTFLIILVAGTGGFMLLDQGRHSALDYLYMTVITVTTVGYGEVIDLSGNPAGRVFAIVLIFAGMGVILYFISNVTAFLIEGDLNEIFWRKKMRKMIESMTNHYIVCGAGTVGEHVVRELYRTKRPTVVIDTDGNRLDVFKEEMPEIGIVQGDATDTDVLRGGGIERAVGIISAINNDNDNLVVTITAKQIQPKLRVVTRASELKNIEKLKRAGADSVVSSNFIGGLRMASEMVRPEVVSFLDLMLRDREKSIRIEEVPIPQGSPFAGKTAKDVKDLVLVLAVLSGDGNYTFNPPDSMSLQPGNVLVFMGSPDERERLKERLRAQH